MVLLAASCGSDTGPATSTTGAATTSTSVGVAPQLDIQGHRGARGLAPENTLPGFEIALDLEVSTLELDLHFSADGRVVVWHDPAVDREKCGLAPGAPPDVPDPDDVLIPDEDLMIRNLEVAQLSWYRCDRNPAQNRYPEQQAVATALAGDDFRIVTLAEVFDFVAAYASSEAKTERQRRAAMSVEFNIETKRKPDRPETIGDGFDGASPGPFESAVLADVAERSLTSRVVIQSFDHRSLWAVRSVDTDIRLAALSVREPVDHDALAARGASIWSPNFDAVTEASLAAARAAGLRVIPWTVNDPDDMARLIDLGVDGLITDRPDLLVDLVGTRGQSP